MVEPGAGFAPAMDVYYDVDEAGQPRAVVQADLAGVDPDVLELDVEGRALLLRGVRLPQDGEGRAYQQLEIESGGFQRVIEFGADVLADDVRATFRDGMLRVTLPLAVETPRIQTR